MHPEYSSLTLEIEFRHCHCAFAGDNSNYRAATPANKEDGAPHQGERKTQRSGEHHGEKHLEGPARTRPCRVQRVGPRIPEGGPVRAAVSKQLRSQFEQLQS